jgi:hypothetical protein
VSIYPLSLPEGEQMGVPTSCFGSFSSTQTQSLVVAPNATPLSYNTVDIAQGGVVLSGATPTASIYIPGNGVYRVITSVQIDKTSGGGNVGDAFLWFGVNGTAVPNTATKTQITNNTEIVMTVEVLLSLNTGDLISIVGQGATGGEQAVAYVASGIRPTIPSIITIVQRIT